MKDKIYEAFNDIKAEEELKKDTYDFLQRKINQKRKFVSRRKVLTFASVICLLVLILIPYNLYFTKTAFVDIDVNPSIELALNRFGYVIEANAYNADGGLVLNNVEVKNKSYKDTLMILIDEMIDMNYIQNSELFTATLQMEGAEKEKWLVSLKDYIDSALKSKDVSVQQEVFEVDSDTKTHSHEQNLTPAKYITIIEAQTVDPTVTFDSCRDHTITEIKEHMHNYRNRHGEDSDRTDSTDSTESTDSADCTESTDTTETTSDKDGKHHSERRHGEAH